MAASKSVAKVYQGSDGAVHVVHSDGSDIAVPKLKDEASRSEPVISEDKRSAGWVVNFEDGPVGSTTTLPLQLVIYRMNRPVLRFSGRPIWKWTFVQRGAKVAYYMNTLHGDNQEYRLHDVQTGRLLGKVNGALQEKSPSWTDALGDFK